MSLPTAKPTAQSSLRSFFQPNKAPKYAPPPGQLPPLPPPPPATATPPQQSSSPPAPIFKPSYIPPQSDIRLIAPDDLPALKRTTALLLPVAFPDAVFNEALSSPFCRVITWTDDTASAPKIVGSVICRPEVSLQPTPDGRVRHNLYIRSLCLLSPYRSHGLVNAAIDSICSSALADINHNFQNITAHVWTENDEGLAWYQNRGFERSGQPIENYYIKLRPGSAYLVTRPIAANVRAALPGASAGPPPAAAGVPGPSVTAAVLNMTNNGTPPPPPPAAGAPPARTAQSYQNQRPETEWNDLPEEMMNPSMLIPPRVRNASEANSNASSRSSSSAAKKRRDRSYPAAAFGN
ncbi:hypothetical protein VHEMI04208 [[Torrubiella] hemipterigena]|uniref:N-acetyltransferase domain-containing protein n=1 Tax=[Torrubiella] hemipterigena TaxID=1531966 RepID=A0A0A1SUQ7_9HYPO|nr:hypothetical protein VHEMI04208 [[Torrubiella] hemipterigena]